MLLAVDIGNSNIKMALFGGRKILHIWRLTTEKNKPFKQYAQLLKKLFAQKRVKETEIKEAIICSVVPKLTAIFSRALFSRLKKRPLILGKDIIAPIKNLYRRPEQVGQDRLANAVAAFSKYGGPAVVVDFGTALTFDVVSVKGSYLGGIIVPGVAISLEALIKKAALLPEIRLSKPASFIGGDTVSSMKSGIVYGYSFLVEAILRRLKKELRQKPKIVATGGEAALISLFCPSIRKIEENLTLQGLWITYQSQKKGKNT